MSALPAPVPVRAAAASMALLSEQPTRRLHSAAVATCAEMLSADLTVDDRRSLVAAAWLHDIGHAAALRTTGLHALDGARYLEGRFPRRVVDLVAHHSGARFEAEMRGFGRELAAFDQERSLVADLLTYCDMTTGPDGERVDLHSRLDEVEVRYGADHLVVQALRLAQPELTRAVGRVERDLPAASTVHRSEAGPPAR